MQAPANETGRGGPLAGLMVVEMEGVGPGPFAAMWLADMGATVIRVSRPGQRYNQTRRDVLNRSRRSIAVDLKKPGAVEIVLRLIERADALIEGFRPGVMERLGLGPRVCLERNPRLVYGRVTGWGQDGPLALAGALGAIGRKDAPPTPPLNLVADYGGGALYLALGMLAAMMHARARGEGQVVDAAMVDGVASLLASVYGMHAAGMLSPERGSNVSDSGAYFYDVYACADGRWISIAPIEGRFHAELLRRIGIDPHE